MLTEEQAKEKWCPFARVGVPTDYAPNTAINRFANGSFSLPGLRCIASECMAWRSCSPFKDIVETRPILSGETLPVGFDGQRHGGDAPPHGEWFRYSNTPRGYCGLAGQVTP